MLESSCFKDVQPTGSNGHLYKVDQRNHMNPYLIRATYTFHDVDGAHRGAGKVGVTDRWKNKSCGHVSTSGAKVYAQGSPGVAAGALRAVCALLEEADVDVPNDRNAALRLAGDGGVWGTDPQAHAQGQHSKWAGELGLPPLFRMPMDVARAADPGRPWAGLAEDDAMEALDRAQAVIRKLPANSARSRFAQAAAAVLSAEIARGAQAAW